MNWAMHWKQNVSVVFVWHRRNPLVTFIHMKIERIQGLHCHCRLCRVFRLRFVHQIITKYQYITKFSEYDSDARYIYQWSTTTVGAGDIGFCFDFSCVFGFLSGWIIKFVSTKMKCWPKRLHCIVGQCLFGDGVLLRWPNGSFLNSIVLGAAGISIWRRRATDSTAVCRWFSVCTGLALASEWLAGWRGYATSTRREYYEWNRLVCGRFEVLLLILILCLLTDGRSGSYLLALIWKLFDIDCVMLMMGFWMFFEAM